MLFHITPRSEWELAVTRGSYAPASLASEGFIHLSTAEQWPRTLERWFPGRAGLVLLTIDPALLTHEVRFEPVHGDHFPHLFGPLDVKAVIAVTDLRVTDDGQHRPEPRDRARR